MGLIRGAVYYEKRRANSLRRHIKSILNKKHRLLWCFILIQLILYKTNYFTSFTFFWACSRAHSTPVNSLTTAFFFVTSLILIMTLSVTYFPSSTCFWTSSSALFISSSAASFNLSPSAAASTSLPCLINCIFQADSFGVFKGSFQSCFIRTGFIETFVFKFIDGGYYLFNWGFRSLLYCLWQNDPCPVSSTAFW